MKLRCLCSFVVICLSLLAGIAVGAPETHLLRLSTPDAGNFDINLEVRAKSRMQMLFMPLIDTYFRLGVDQQTRLVNANGNGIVTSESQIATATLDYYMPGQPNQGMDDSVLETLLWASGLGSRETPITISRNHLGIVTNIEGIPEQYQMYYQHDLIYYPEYPVTVGDSWKRKFTQPIAVDFHQAPYDLEITGKYTLKRLHNNGKEAEITFEFLAESDYAMQRGKRVKVDVKLLRQGSMLISLKDGWPRSIKSLSTFNIAFSEHNYIKSEEEYKSVISETTRKELEKAD